MAVRRCKKGHFYDDEKYVQCPHCEKEIEDDSVTMAADSPQMKEYVARYMQKVPAAQKIELDSEKTIGLYSERGTKKYVAGWLVCIKGPSRGTDYRIYAGFNRIGRGYSNDIVLKEDMQVTRDEHCSVVYEEKENCFYVVPKAGNLVYLDGDNIEHAIKISDGKILEVGKSSLEFVSFCKGEKRWK